MGPTRDGTKSWGRHRWSENCGRASGLKPSFASIGRGDMERMTSWRSEEKLMRHGDGPAVPAARQAQASGVLFGAIVVLCLNCGLLESRVWHVKLFGGKSEG
jgi:hypothetical protein